MQRACAEGINEIVVEQRRVKWKKNKKIRNHISIVAEQIGGGFAALAAVAFGILIQNADELMEVDFSFAEAGRGLMIVGGILLLFIAAAVKQIWTWSKTWIYIDGQTIVIERNTVNQKVNTIGIKNIPILIQQIYLR